MFRVDEYMQYTVPASMLVSGLGQAPAVTPSNPATIASAGPTQAAGILLLLGAGIAVIGGMYYWKSAAKMGGFWKGWGYFNSVGSYATAAGLTLSAIGLIAIPDEELKNLIKGR